MKTRYTSSIYPIGLVKKSFLVLSIDSNEGRTSSFLQLAEEYPNVGKPSPSFRMMGSPPTLWF